MCCIVVSILHFGLTGRHWPQAGEVVMPQSVSVTVFHAVTVSPYL
jgi:hypothetical protein